MAASTFLRMTHLLPSLSGFAVIGLLSAMVHGQQLLEHQSVFDAPEFNSPYATFPFTPFTSEQRMVPANAGLISITRASHRILKDAAAQFKQGIHEKKKKRPAEALAHFLEATRLDPLYWDAHVSLSNLYWESGQQSAALDSLNAALAIDPNSDALQANKSVALLALGHPDMAEQAAWRSLQLRPGSEAAHYLIGLARLRQRKFDAETVAHLAKAVGTIPQAYQLHADAKEILSRQH